MPQIARDSPVASSRLRRLKASLFESSSDSDGSLALGHGTGLFFYIYESFGVNARNDPYWRPLKWYPDWQNLSALFELHGKRYMELAQGL